MTSSSAVSDARLNFAAAALAVTAACSDAAVATCSTAGPQIPVVSVDVDDRENAPGVVLEEVWRVGGSNSGQELAFPVSVAVSATGHAAVVDMMLAEVIVIDPDGSWTGVWGGRGEGPGELRMPVAVTWRADTLLVFDIEQRKISAFRDGEVAAPDVSVPTDFVSPVTASGTIEYASLRSDRTVFLKYPFRALNSRTDSAVFAVMAYHPSANVADTVVSSRVPVIHVGGQTILQPGAAHPSMAVGSDGWSASSAANGDYAVVVTDPQGDPVLRICGDLEPHTLSAAERGAGDIQPGFEDFASAIASASAPDRLTTVGRMLVGAGGEVWIDRNRPTPFTNEGLHGRPGATLDAYDSEGRYLGEVRTPAGVSIQAISDSFAVGLTFSELDVPSLVGYRLVVR